MTVFIMSQQHCNSDGGTFQNLLEMYLSCFRIVAIIPILQSHKELLTGAFFLEARAVK